MISSVIHWLFSSIVFSLHVFVVFALFFLSLISSFIALCLENMFDMFKIFLNLPRLGLWPRMWSILENWVSYRQHMYGSCFGIHSSSLCLLIGVFSPFTCEIIIDTYVLTAILLIVLYLFLLVSSLLLLFNSLMVSWLSFVFCYYCFFSFVCVFIADFWFVVTMRFWYRNTHTHMHMHIHTRLS